MRAACYASGECFTQEALCGESCRLAYWLLHVCAGFWWDVLGLLRRAESTRRKMGVPEGFFSRKGGFKSRMCLSETTGRRR